MPSWDVNTGSLGAKLRLIVDIVDTDAAARTYDVRFRLQLVSVNSATFVGNNIACSISGSGISTISTTFTWAQGTSSKTLIDVTRTISANSNGAFSGSYTGSIGATGTQGIGGPTSNGPRSVSFPTLTVPPNTPTGCSASRVSDSQASVSWSQSHPSNGQPTSNTIRRRINGGSWSTVATISPANSVTLDAAVNQKLEYAVRANNSEGNSNWSNTSPAIYTSPQSPTNVQAAKDAALDITVSWTPRVGFSEHEHQVEFSTNGGSSWQTLATVSAGTSTYKHVNPDPGLVHVYRVRARNTSTGNLTSAWVQSNSVQLLAAPNAPSLANLPPFADKAVALPVEWTHNPVDTTPQTAYEVEYSTNGGSSYSSTGKVTSTSPSYSFAAGSYAGDVQLTVRVRTWGEATTGGADGTGASPWSTTDTVTFKTRPVATITSPADASTWEQAALSVDVDFSQAEGASFVQATIVLAEGSTVLEELQSTTLPSTALETTAEDGGEYTITVTVRDSNGLVSDPVQSTFLVDFTEPVTATFTAEYLPDSGIVQLDVTIPEAGVGEVAAVGVTIFRTIDGVRETVVSGYPIEAGTVAFLDTTPTTHGTNEYEVRTTSADGATKDSDPVEVATVEDLWAFASTGPGFSNIVRFCGDLEWSIASGRQSALVVAAGREKPIALFGENTTWTLSGSATLAPDLGVDPREMNQFLTDARLTCLRLPDGTRRFGYFSGEVAYPLSPVTELRFRLAEAS